MYVCSCCAQTQPSLKLPLVDFPPLHSLGLGSPESQRRHFCGSCSLSFASALDLKRHERSKHTFIRRHWCQFCNTGFYKSDHLAVHLRNCGEGNGVSESSGGSTSRLSPAAAKPPWVDGPLAPSKRRCTTSHIADDGDSPNGETERKEPIGGSWSSVTKALVIDYDPAEDEYDPADW